MGDGDVSGVAALMPRWKKILQPIRKRCGGESAATNTPERQTAGADTSQTTPTKPCANPINVRHIKTPVGLETCNRTRAVQREHGTPLGPASVDLRHLETEAKARCGQASYDDYYRPSMATGERETGEQTGGQFMAKIPPHGAPWPYAEQHNERERHFRSQGKTSGETKQDYGVRDGFDNVETGDVMWAGDKEKCRQYDAVT